MKCENCSKKIRLISFSCKCNLSLLCTHCKDPNVHHCMYDYREEERKRLEKINPMIVAEKMIKI